MAAPPPWAPRSWPTTRVQLRRGQRCKPRQHGYNLTNDKTSTACEFDAATDLVNKNPLLGALANNGGPTQTMLPGAKSPAADVIPKTTTLRGVVVCPGTDQRGIARPGRGETRCTIGAVEVGFNNPTTTSVTVRIRWHQGPSSPW